MAKQDVIDAINATIVPNGSKAINADSLRNLLLLMAENMGGWWKQLWRWCAELSCRISRLGRRNVCRYWRVLSTFLRK